MEEKSMKQQHLIILVLITIATFLIYYPTLHYGYNFDDYIVVENHPYVQSGIRGIPKIIGSYYNQIDGDKFEWRFFTKISYAIEYQIFGKNTTVNHLGNLILYVICCFMLYLLLRTLFYANQQKFIFYIVTILCFVCHPLHVEVVASLKNREEIFASLFVYLSFLLILKLPNKISTFLWILSISFLAFASKVSAVLFIFVVPVSLYLFRRDDLKRVVINYLAMGISLVIYVGLMLIFFPSTYDRITSMPLFESHIAKSSGIWVKLATAFHTVWLNIKLLFVPYPLSAFYGYKYIDFYHWNHFFSWVGLILLFTISALIFTKKLFQPIKYGLLVLMVTLLLFSNIVVPVPGGIADRILFNAVVVIALILGGLVKDFGGHKWQYFKLGVVIMIIGAYGFLSGQRVLAWKSKYELATIDANSYPSSFMVNLVALIETMKLMEHMEPGEEKSNLDEMAFQYSKKMISIDSTFRYSYCICAEHFYYYQPNIDSALHYYNKALEEPDCNNLYLNLSEIYLQKGDSIEAFKYYQKSLEVKTPN